MSPHFLPGPASRLRIGPAVLAILLLSWTSTGGGARPFPGPAAGAPQKSRPGFPALAGPYLGQTPPGAKAELFAPGLVSTGMTERAVAISPDGREVYFELAFGQVVTIMVTRIEGRRWTEPVVAPFAADLGFFHFEPCLSADGRRMLFLSNRPRAGEKPLPGWGHQNIWASDRAADGRWGEPYDLGGPVNSAESAFFPSLTRDGTLYFTRSSPSGEKARIMRSRPEEGRFGEPVELPKEVNGRGTVFNAFIAPDESYLIACVEGRVDSPTAGAANYYIFFRSQDDSWSEGVNLGPEVNFPGAAASAPYVTSDGRYLFFGSNRRKEITSPAGSPMTWSQFMARFCGPQNGGSDVYWIDASFLRTLKSKGGAEASQPGPHDVFAFVQTLDKTAGLRLWPGFDPARMPIALFDGERTVLLRHPAPPPEFIPLPDRPGVLFYKGRYPAVVSNRVVEIGGALTGTVLATPNDPIHGTLLACIEEVFHAFWRPRHPSLRPDEMIRYGYPIDDAENLVRLLAEDEALARAIESDGDRNAAAWAAAATKFRAERTASLSPDVLSYETAMETMEGTANYVSRLALGETPSETAVRLRQARPADGIRWRFYDSGAAVCMLLERLLPGWKDLCEQDPAQEIGGLLGAELMRRRVAPATFSLREMKAFRAAAETRIAGLARSRREMRADVLGRPGARVLIELAAGARPLRVERFDPMSLSILDRGQVVHANYLTLSGESGSIEVANPEYVRRSFAGTVSLTESAGRHPLTAGVRRLTVLAIRSDPRVSRDNGVVRIESPEIRASLAGADVRVQGQTIRVTLPKR